MNRRLYAIFVAIVLGMGLLTSCGSNIGPTENTQGTTSDLASGQPTVAESTVPPETTASRDYMITEEIVSKSIADNNLLDDTGLENIYVYLPPDYYDSEESYPVVYYLHGHGETPGAFVQNSVTLLDKLFASGEKSFIMVEIAGTGRTGGSFYVNSPSSGYWEDFITDEVIPFVDANYRTFPQAESRGICGFSMGGFGAMNLALKNPDVFAAVYSMSPGIMKDDALPEAMRTWTGDTPFLIAYGRAFAPNPENTKTFGSVPAMDGSEEDQIIVDKWYGGFGNWRQKLDAYLALGTPLRAIGISYGSDDYYSWIPTGCADYVELLRAAGIEPTVFAFDGGHSMPVNTFEDHLGPFFQENLTWG